MSSQGRVFTATAFCSGETRSDEEGWRRQCAQTKRITRAGTSESRDAPGNREPGIRALLSEPLEPAVLRVSMFVGVFTRCNSFR